MSFILVRSRIQRCCQKAAYLDNHLLCRIVVHSCGMQLLNAQFSPIVNTEPKSTRRMCQNGTCRARSVIRRSGPAKNISSALGIRALSYRAASEVVQPSRLDAATRVDKGYFPMSDEDALHAVLVQYEMRR